MNFKDLWKVWSSSHRRKPVETCPVVLSYPGPNPGIVRLTGVVNGKVVLLSVPTNIPFIITCEDLK